MKRLLTTTKNKLRQVRHSRVRALVKGTAAKPRLSVFRGNKAMELQLIDDEAGKTLCAVKTVEIKAKTAAEGRSTKASLGFLAGKLLAEKAMAKGIKAVVFDRGGYSYHGRVAAVADGAREGGLTF
jgi:large subunit ribosomal protein L18